LSAGVEVLACETCGSAEKATHGSTRGERLLQHLRTAHAQSSQGCVSVSSVRCLWACKRSCAVHLRAPGKPGYVLVELEANETAARAVLDYAAMYGESVDGAVPFRRWPDPLRGHFLCRTPPVLPEPSATPPLASQAGSDKDSP